MEEEKAVEVHNDRTGPQEQDVKQHGHISRPLPGTNRMWCSLDVAEIRKNPKYRQGASIDR